jgi:hypothetical protein
MPKKTSSVLLTQLQTVVQVCTSPYMRNPMFSPHHSLPTAFLVLIAFNTAIIAYKYIYVRLITYYIFGAALGVELGASTLVRQVLYN